MKKEVAWEFWVKLAIPVTTKYMAIGKVKSTSMWGNPGYIIFFKWLRVALAIIWQTQIYDILDPHTASPGNKMFSIVV